MEIFVKNTVNGLLPLYPADLDEKKRLKIGEVYKVKITNPRNYEFHKKFMALVNLAHSNTNIDMPFDAYRKYLVSKAGYFKAYTTPKGTYIEPESISFGNMSQSEFETVYSRVLDVIIKELGCTTEEVEQELINFM